MLTSVPKGLLGVVIGSGPKAGCQGWPQATAKRRAAAFTGGRRPLPWDVTKQSLAPSVPLGGAFVLLVQAFDVPGPLRVGF